MRSRFAHSETTLDRQTVFPLLCVGLLVEVILKLQTMVWVKSMENFPQCFTANISFVLLPIPVLLFKLIKLRFVIYILVTLFSIQSLSPSLSSHKTQNSFAQ
jgi:hypothetical protein